MKGQSVRNDAVLCRSATNAERGLGPRLRQYEFRAWMLAARAFVRSGNLRVRYRNSAETTLGDGAGPAYTIDVDSCRFLRRMALSPEIAFGEGYMDGGWRTRNSKLADVIGLLLKNQLQVMNWPRPRFVQLLQKVVSGLRHKRNNPAVSRANVAHHYDIGNDLYRSFLDRDMNYSCAFFEDPASDLEHAQRNKLRTTIARLDIRPGMSILDIGCGWGALTRLIAGETAAAHIVGITLAEEQLALARKRAMSEYGNRLRYVMADYRDHARENPSRYDRIVSIGMFEHVGERQFETYFRSIERMLRPGGRTLIHAIIRPRKNMTSPWVEKYIFPGGYIPTLQELTGSALRIGLDLVRTPYIHGSVHYATTLRHWRKRFNAAYPNLNQQRYDARFRRMWNFYLAGSEAAFDATGFSVAQAVFEKPE
jgi:cyclopropane-fatty-acyl-phospholipid synthase